MHKYYLPIVIMVNCYYLINVSICGVSYGLTLNDWTNSGDDGEEDVTRNFN